MLADAIRAEGYRLTKSRTTWFWSIFFVPILGLVMSVIGNVVLKATGPSLMVNGKAPPEVALALAGGPVDLGQTLVSTAGDLANPVVLLFVLIGAATLYAGDYRWETWRLISARNSRDNLVLGKTTVLAVMVVAAMVVLMIGNLGENLITAMVLSRPLAFTMDGGDFGQMLLLFGLSWLRILQFTMIGLLAAVMSRSLLAALFVPLVVGVAQFFSPGVVAQMGLGPDSWVAVLINPGSAAGAIKALIEGGPAAQMLPDGLVLKASISLAFWTLAPLLGAIAWFRRQDLSKE